MTDAILPPDDDPVILAGEYALGLLGPAEARAFEARMVGDTGLRREYARWAEDLSRLVAEAAEVTPPAAARAALEARLFPEESQGWLRRLGVVPALLAGLVAAMLLLVANNLGWLGSLDPDNPGLPLRIAAADDSMVVAAVWDAAQGVLTLDREVGAAPDGRVLELWLIAGEGVPVSLGLLAEAGSTVIAPPVELAALMAGATLAISDEPPGGSPTGLPTGSVLATGVVIG